MSKYLKDQISKYLPHWRERVAAPGMRAVLAALVVCVCLVSFISWYWTADLEESTKISYSAGAALSSPVSQYGRDLSGIHSVLGVPVYDTMQGTGNRLPYQASWAQSVTWPLRFLVSWQQLTPVRTLFFAVPTMWLAMLMLLSWVPRMSLLRLSLFGFLISAPFGLFLRQLEWSDTYTQTMGILGVCFLLLHRSLLDDTSESRICLHRFVPLAVLVSTNALTTGHPGVWPIALFVWSMLFLILSVDSRFRVNVWSWFVTNRVVMLLILGTNVVTVGTVVVDLRSESRGLSFGADRLGEAQGFIGESVFQGATRGLLPDSIERLLSLAAASSIAPLLRPFRSIIGEIDALHRIASLSERAEFAGTLVLVAFLVGFQHVEDHLLRKVLTRAFMAQLGAVVLMVLSAEDALPATLTSSGAWLLFPVLLVINITFSIILLSSLTKRLAFSRVLLQLNLTAALIWTAVLILAPLSHDIVGLPKRFTRSFGNETLTAKNEPSKVLQNGHRTIILTESDSDEADLPQAGVFLELVLQGIPVVAPSDPKIRNSTHLIETFAFQNSINYWDYRRIELAGNSVSNSLRYAELISERIDLVTDFLQIRTILTKEFESYSVIKSAGFHRYFDSPKGNDTVALRGHTFQVFSREQFHSFIFNNEKVEGISRCAILVDSCEVLSAERVGLRNVPALSICEIQKCLWRYYTPSFGIDQVLVIPVTYDSSLRVADMSGNVLSTLDVGGFLGVRHDDDVSAGELTISVSPDLRMVLRVVASYLNMFAFIVAAVLTRKQRSPGDA